MRDSQEIVRELGELLDKPDAGRRDRLMRAIVKESIPGKIRLLGNQVVAVGLAIDRWIVDGGCAGVVFTNKEEQPSVWQLNLGCKAGPDDLPIVATVDDGESRREVRFDAPGNQRLDIEPVPPGSERLFIISTDRTWCPGGHDQRQLGVNVDVTPTGTLESLLEAPDRAARERLTTEIAREAFADKIRLLGNQVVAAGLSLDHWTEDGAPAALVYTNYDDQEVAPELLFACHATPDLMPVTLFIEDGQRRREYTFEEAGGMPISLTPVGPHSQKLYVISADKTWSPGPGDPRQLGVSVNVSPSWTLGQLMRKPDAYIRVKLAEVIANEPVTGKVELLGGLIMAVGLTRDRWTEGDEPAALVVTNSLDTALVPELRVGCHAGPDELPLTATVDDGQEPLIITFDQPGEREVALTPVPRHSRRLFIISTDRTWTPGSSDPRQLGVSLTLEPSRALAALAERYDRAAWKTAAGAILAGQLPDTRVLEPEVAAVAGVYPDGWTVEQKPAGLALRGADEGGGGKVLELVLGCHAGPDDMPIKTTLLDGDRSVEVLFEEAGERTVVLDPLQPGADRLVIITSDRSWCPGGGDSRDLGVLVDRVHQSLVGTIGLVSREDDLAARAWVLEQIRSGETPDPINLLEGIADAAGLTGDQWTGPDHPAALALVNPGDGELVLDLKLECHAEVEALPICAAVVDGARRQDVRFKERGVRTVTLDPLSAGEQRLVLVTTDRTWSPGTEEDQRQLGVRVSVEE